MTKEVKEETTKEEVNEDFDLNLVDTEAKVRLELKSLGEEDLLKDMDSSTTATDKEESKDVKDRKFTELELEQMERGWDPDHPDGVSAKEFKRVGEIIDAKRAASKKAAAANKEVEELTKTVKNMVERQRKAEQLIYEKAMKDLALQKMQKIQEGDVDGVLVIEQEQQRLETTKPSTESVVDSTPQEEDHPAILEFRKRNSSWLQSTSPEDIEMQEYVKYRAGVYMKNDPDIDPDVAITSIEEGLAKEFPDKFSNPKKTKPPVTLKSTAVGGSSSYSSANLSFEEREEFNLIKKADPSYTLKEYVDQLKLVGRIKE